MSSPRPSAGPRPRIGGRPFRPPTGLPRRKEGTRAGAAVSLLIHGAIILLLIGPAAWASKEAIERLEQGAGGPGPAGGGGGGTRGTGGERTVERITFATPPRPVPTPVPAVTPPQVTPPPLPKPVVTPTPTPVTPAVAPPVAATPAASTIVTTTPGSGGGTGADGSGGNGPGSGGGVGSGIGTGRGSGVGPGTGGGNQANYPPEPTEMFLPPMPVPAKVRGFHLIAEFDVDETGRVVSMKFTETRDGDYNRKLREILRSIRFRPGTRPDGTPVRMKAQIEYSL